MTDNIIIDNLIKKLTEEISKIENLDEKIDSLNKVKLALSEVSPFKSEAVDTVLWIKGDSVIANDYNPNSVASPEMKSLHLSIKEDSYTQPIVAYYDKSNNEYIIVDGFHRNIIGKEYSDIKERIYGYLPITIIDKGLDERITSTIRHNRARGSHQINEMSNIVLILNSLGWDDYKICNKLGMEIEEVLRLKQRTGLTEAFKNHVFSNSWEELIEKLPNEKEGE
ncbi:parB-like nuclease domain protein [Clostridioides difficile CD160]|nr:parB-like nuclease domain protein [Clostridioides difficile CD160]